jgi:HPr kinase/phosphorylase
LLVGVINGPRAVVVTEFGHMVHGTAVALGARAVLLRGHSGVGKSDLALRYLMSTAPIDGGHDRRLVADDQVCLTRDGDCLLASCPATLLGQLEVRGIGIVQALPVIQAVKLCLIVDLVAPQTVPRMPDERFERLHGVEIPLLVLAPFEASAPVKLALILSRLG